MPAVRAGSAYVDFRANMAPLRKDVARATGPLGKQFDKLGRTADRSMRRADKSTGRVASNLKRIAGAAAGAAVGYASIAQAKKAVSTTTDLAKTTISLSKSLGLSTKRASEFAAVLKARGVEGKQVNQAFGTLAKNAVAGAKGVKSQAESFKALGISQRELKTLKADKLIGEIATGMKKMGDTPARTAVAMKLFGRGWQTVVPLMRDGSKGMNEQLALATKYGATFGGKTIKSMKDWIQAQREAKLATMGLQVSFATTVIPTLTKGVGAFAAFVAETRRGKGPIGALITDFKRLRSEGKSIPDALGAISGQVVGKIASAAGRAAPAAARAFFDGWRNTDVGGKAALAIFAAWKLGLFRRHGAMAGAALGSSLAASATTSAAPALAGMGIGGTGGKSKGFGKKGPQSPIWGPKGPQSPAPSIAKSQGSRFGGIFGGAMATSAGSTAARVLPGKMGALKGRMAAVGKGVLGVGLMMGIADAATSRGDWQTRLGRGLSTASFGLLPPPKEMAERLKSNLNQALAGGSANFPGWDKFLNTLGQSLDTKGKALVGKVTLIRRALVAQFGDVRLKVNLDPSVAIRAGKQLDINMNRLKNNLGGDFKSMARISSQNMRLISQTMGLNSKSGRKAVTENMRASTRAIKDAMASGSLSSKAGMKAIRRAFVINSKGAKESAQTNFNLASSAIRSAVNSGQITAKQGLKEIRRLFRSYLAQFGIKGNAADTYLKDPSGGTEGSVTPDAFKARGGMVGFGRPGGRGRDTIPAVIGAQRVAVGSGEVATVWNRHQLPEANARFADVGGLAGYFQRNRKPHYLAKGGTIPRQIVGGPNSAIRRMDQEGLDLNVGAANAKLRAAKRAKQAQEAEAGSGPSGKPTGVKGVVSYGGLKFGIAKWVLGALKHAAKKGVNPTPTSGYRPHWYNVQQGRTYKSEHEGTQYPHGAVDYGDFHSGLAAKMAVVGATRDYKHPLLAPIGFVDDGHASGTGHALGGFLAARGLMLAKAAKKSGGKLRGAFGTWAGIVRRNAKGRKAATIFESMLRANAVETGGLGNNPMGGDGGKSAGWFQMTNEKGSVAQRRNAGFAGRWYVRTALGAYRKGISAALLAANTERPAEQYRFKYGDPKYVPLGQIRELMSRFQGGSASTGGASPKKKGTKPLTARQKKYRKWASRQTRKIKGIGLSSKTEARLKSLRGDADYFGELADRAGQLSTDAAQGRVPGAWPMQKGYVDMSPQGEAQWLDRQLQRLFSLRNTLIRAHASVGRKRKHVTKKTGGLQKLVRRLRKNPKAYPERLRAAKKMLSAYKGVGGKLDTRKGELVTDLETVQGARGSMAIMRQLPTVGTLGGDIFTAQMRLRELGQKATATDNSTDTSDRSDNLAELLRAANLRTAVAERQFGVFRDMPAWAGSFGGGGVVPGPTGAPRMIEAHGRETIFTPEQMRALGGQKVEVIIHGDIVSDHPDPVQLVIGDKRFPAAVARANKTQTRGGRRPLPGRSGGGLRG